MAVAELVINIIAGTASFSTGMKQITKELNAMSSRVSRFGATASRVTAPIAGIGIASLKFAKDFDAAFTGVKKTVDGTEAQFKSLRKEILDLSSSTGTAATDLAEIAEIAGQQGIDVKNIAEFTKNVNELSVAAADLTAADAATQLAQFTNITGAGIETTKNLASAITQIGNSMATTEGRTLAMAKNIAAAGNQVGLTDAQILGIAGSLSAMGVEAEKGGTAVSKLFINMANDVATGGGNLQEFARISKMTVDEFSALFREDASQALQKFIGGLSESENALVDLANLKGFSEVRLRDVVLRLTAGFADPEKGLAAGIKLATDAFIKGTAASEEFQKKLDSDSGKVDRSFTRLVTAGIKIGEIMLPILADFAQWVAGVVEQFDRLDPSVQKIIIGVGAFAVAIGPVAFALAGIIKVVGVTIAVLVGSGGLLFAIKGVIAVIAVFATPAGLMVAAIGGIVAAVIYFREEIAQWVKEVEAATQRIRDAFKEKLAEAIAYVEDFVTKVKLYLVDKFNSIVDAVGEKVDDITGFFKDMWDKVVGHSYVPDMVDGIGIEFDRLDSVMVNPTLDATMRTSSAFSQMGLEVNNTLADLIGDLGGFGDKVTGLIGTISDAIGGASGGSGSGGFGGLLGDLVGGQIQGGDLFGSLFGEATQGPLMQDGSFFPGGGARPGAGLFAGAGTGNAYMAAATDILAGISKIGKSTVETSAGIGQAAGAAFGAAFGGPAGAAIGGTLGEIGGKYLGKGIKHMFGGEHVETTARKEFKKFFDNLLQDTDIQIFDADGQLQSFKEFNLSAKDTWNQSNWAGEFKDAAGAAFGAFDGVGKALATMSGLADVHGEQIAKMLFDNVGGSVENLGLLIAGLQIPIEDFESSLMQALDNGEIGLREYIIAMQGVDQAFQSAEAAQKDLDLATQMWIATGGDSIETLETFKNVVKAAMSQGITSVQGLVDHMRKSGKFTEEQLEVLVNAFKAHGIESMDALANAGDRTLASIMVFMSSVKEDGGANFFAMADSAERAFNRIEQSAKDAGNAIKNNLSNIRVNAQVNYNTTPSYKGNIFEGGQIKQFSKGGVVSQFTKFNIGSMAEHGPEAIMPLDRLPNGMLGVRAALPSNTGSETNNFYIDAKGAEIGVEKRIKRAIEDYLDRKNREVGRRI